MARKNDRQDDIARLETALEEMRSRERELEASRKAMLFLLEDLEANRRLIEQAKREWTAVFDTLRDAVFIHDREMRIVRANRAYAERAGMEVKDLIGRPYWQAFPKRAEPLPCCLRALQKAEEEEEEEEEIKAGESILRSRAFTIRDPDKAYQYSVHILEDITERKRTEQALQKLNRALRVLSECNEALIHAEDEPDLLGDVCRVIVETGSYRMAWVGFAEHDEGKTVRPVAHCGHEAGILESARISWAENEQCLAGIAIRTGTVQVAQNFGADSRMAAVYPETAKRGYASGIALPFKDASGAFGALVIVAAEPDAFNVEEVKLLQELADDLAYGIGALRARADRLRAEQEVQASAARLHRIVEQQADGLVVVDMNGVVAFLNPAAERFLGQPRDALLESPFGYPVIGKAATEIQVARPDGSTAYAEMRAIESEWGGEQVHLLSLHDITEHKQFEEERQQGAARLKRALQETIQAVALAAEKRDPYTAGHQQRVTELAAAIAREIGWEENRIEGLRLGAVIHDIGKIYVPAEILSRPGKLSPTEFEMIKSHCQEGYEIMRGVEFPWPVAEMILQHHERLDGSGYPNGLKGDEILPEARILMVADVVEAMASHRPYRAALSLDAALAEIAGKRGTGYEAEAVDACLRLFREKGYRLQ